MSVNPCRPKGPALLSMIRTMRCSSVALARLLFMNEVGSGQRAFASEHELNDSVSECGSGKKNAVSEMRSGTGCSISARWP